MTVFLALHEAFKATPDPQATVKFRQRVSQMLKDVPANYSGLRKEYEVRNIRIFIIYLLIIINELIYNFCSAFLIGVQHA